jgi:hypothetical protein
MKPFIPKQDDRLPDFFTVTINYLTGRKETLEVVSCNYYNRIVDDMGNITSDNFDCYEIWTKDDLMKIVPKASIESIDYDKNWSKIVAIKQELAKNK